MGREMLTSRKIWDPRQKHCVDYLETNFPITAVAVNDAGSELFTGGIDNEIKVMMILEDLGRRMT